MQETITNQHVFENNQLQRITNLSALIAEFRISGLLAADFAKKKGIPRSTFYWLLQRAREGLAGFVDRRISKRARSTRIDARCRLWILAFMAYHRRATMVGAWRALKPFAEEQGWCYPSYCQVRHAIRILPQDARDLMVHGGRHNFEKWGLVKRKEESVPNMLWQIDATEVPVWCLDTVTGEQFKPWAIGMVDCASRVVLRLVVLRTEPDTAALLKALREAVLPKGDERFPFFGRPTKIQSDNGSIFKSADFLDALLRLGITHQAIDNDCPSANGKVERFFRTVQEGLCRQLLQYSEQYRALATAKSWPLPFPLLQQLVDKFLMEYHLRNHRGLAKSPWEAWHEGLMGAEGFDLIPSDVVDACRVRLEKKVARDGIDLGTGRHFSAPELAGLVGQTVTLRLLPEGRDEEIPCYYRGELIATLHRVEGNPELGEQLQAARLERALELAKLRKTLLKTAARILPGQPALMPPGSKTIVPPPPATDEDNLPTEIPKLSPAEED